MNIMNIMNTEYHWITVSDFRKASPISTLWTVRSKAPSVHLDNLRWVGSQIQGCNVVCRQLPWCMIDVGWKWMELGPVWSVCFVYWVYWHFFFGHLPFSMLFVLVTTWPRNGHSLAQFGMFSIFLRIRSSSLMPRAPTITSVLHQMPTAWPKVPCGQSLFEGVRRSNFRIFGPFVLLESEERNIDIMPIQVNSGCNFQAALQASLALLPWASAFVSSSIV